MNGHIQKNKRVNENENESEGERTVKGEIREQKSLRMLAF